MSVLVVGSVALDTVYTPFDSRIDQVGGSATFFSLAASYFSRVRLVGVVGEDFPQAAIDTLRRREVDLEGLQIVPGRTFRWAGKYLENMNDRESLDTQLNVFEAFSPQIPEHWRDSRYVFLGNIEPRLQLQVLDQVRKPELVAMDTMNFWIEGKRADLEKVIARVDLLVINDGEAQLLAGEQNVVRAARKIQQMGPSKVVVKRGEYGAMLFDGHEAFFAPAFPLYDVVDPTGAGDTFAGGVVGHLAEAGSVSSESLRRAVILGSVMASFTVEAFGPERLQALARPEIAERFRAFGRLTAFDSAGYPVAS